MKLIKSNLTKIGVLALAMSALGGSVFAASEIQKAVKNKEDVTAVAPENVEVSIQEYTLTEEDMAELMKEGTIGMAVTEGEDSYVIDFELGKVVEGMNASLVGSGVFGQTGIDVEEVTTEYIEITEDGTVITRPLTAEEMKEFGIDK